MTPDQLDDALDAMQQAAGGDLALTPGLVTVDSDHWVKVLWEIRAKTATLDDGTRHRNIRIVVSSEFETAVLTRTEAAGRGEPYRDLSPRR